MHHRRRVVRQAAAIGLLLLTGCAPEGLAFRTDDRLTFTAPKERSTVRLPITLEWQVRDFEITTPGASVRDDAGYFAVFLDRAPMPPGKPLRWLARDDKGCREDDGCPDDDYLNDRGVYPTAGTRLVLEDLPRTSDARNGRERHRAVVVLLDSSGRRIGESAFEIAFDVDRRAGR